MRRMLAIGFVALACIGAFVLAGAKGGDASNATYKVYFDNAFGLVQGGDFRVGGVKAGKTSAFEVRRKPGQRPLAEVTVKVTQPGFNDFRDDASCDIKPQSLIGEYYVDCQAGNSPRRISRNGGVVPVQHTTSTVPTDLVQDIMREPTRERFRLILTSLGAGLAGRPRDLQQVLIRAHPGLRETSKVLRILGRQNRIIEHFIADSDVVVERLANNKADVVRWIRETGRTAEISATRAADIQRNFQRLPRFLDALRPYMVRLGELTDAQRPLLGDLRKAAPDLTTFLTRLGPFANASRPALKSLGQASAVGNRAFRKGKDDVAELKALAPLAAPTAKPLRQFLQTLDDRKRGIENDQRAKVAAPPPPDKTAIPGQGGFTGFEDAWDYAFWQTLSLNGFDKHGSILRVGVLPIPDCAPYINSNSNPAALSECNQWLGPNQPGITTTDFTDGSAPNARIRRQAGKPAARIGERRRAGQPDAGPLPGQRDISKPTIVLPPRLRRLLEELPRLGGTRPRTPRLGVPSLGRGGTSRSPGDGTELLDFLLAP
jgi:phospholipid/cholesterol/gamma-HCH transport system substrate-binding protein